MPRLTPRYPDGVAGGALLLLRLSCALAAFPALARLWPGWVGWPSMIPPAALALALGAGLGARALAMLLLAGTAAALPAARGETALLLAAAAAAAAALVLLGAGAYSVDAHRFGRRVIRLAPRSPDRGIDG